MQNAMWVFWTRGYHATSIDDLVNATGVARSGIYSEFGGKEEAFIKCLAHYREGVANPAISILHRTEDGFDAIREYFDHFIEMHRQHGMPGPGCFIANAVTEVAPHSDAASEVSSAHLNELTRGFATALHRAAAQAGSALRPQDLDSLARFLSIASQGLWSYARVIDDLAEVEQVAREYQALVRARLERTFD
ncbi:MAG: TetR/AcrR family transcriptional regulator [Parvularcula sp.]|nr:TetR/AcrR family transcriptional regulator [Parvularcula sp.]